MWVSRCSIGPPSRSSPSRWPGAGGRHARACAVAARGAGSRGRTPLPGGSALATRRISLAMIVLCLLVGHAQGAAAAASPRGPWSPPLLLSAPGQNAQYPRVAVAPGGGATAVWERFDGSRWRVQARHVSPTGRRGPVRTLSTPGQDAFAGDVEFGPTGVAAVVWQERGPDGGTHSVRLALLAAGGVPLVVRELDAGLEAAPSPRLVIRPQDGRVTVVWRGVDVVAPAEEGEIAIAEPTVRVAEIDPAGQVALTRSALPTPGLAGNIYNPRPVLDDGGNLVVGWQGTDLTGSDFQAQAVDGAGRLVSLSSPDLRSIDDISFASGPAGLTGIWTYFVPENASPDGNGLGRTALQAGHLGADGTPALLFDRPSARINGVPRIGVDAGGDTILSWPEVPLARDRGTSSVVFRRVSAAGVPGRIRRVSPPTDFAMDHDIAVGPGRALTFVWQDGRGLVSGPVRAVRVSAAGRLGAVHTLDPGTLRDRKGDSAASTAEKGTSTGVTASSTIRTPRLATGPDGTVVAVWRAAGPGGPRVIRLSRLGGR